MPITVSSNMTAAYGGSTITSATTTDTWTENATDVTAGDIDGSHILNIQNVGTSREAMVVGDVNTAKSYAVRLRNLDSDNYVTIETYDGTNYVESGLMYPGEPHGPIRVPAGKTIYLKANTAACNVECMAAELGAAV